MADVSSLKISIDTKEVKTAQKELDKLSSSSNNTEKSTKSLSSGFGALSSVIAGVSIGVLAKQFINTADAMTNVNNQLKLVTNSTEELASAQKGLFDIAQRTRQDYTSTAQTFANFATAMGEMGKSQKEILRVTETVNKAIAISGGTAQQAAAATMQLGQAFASGTLRGDELNSILENSKGLAQAIADGMGVPIGKLRQLGADGKITAEILAAALEKSTKSIDDKFSKTSATVEQSMTVAWNSISLFIGKMDEATGTTSSLSSSIQDMSKYLDSSSEDWVSYGKFVIATLDRTIDMFKLVGAYAKNTVEYTLGGISTLFYGIMAPISKGLEMAAEGLNSIGITSTKTLNQHKQFASDMAKNLSLSRSSMKQDVQDLDDAIQKASPTIEDRIKQMGRLKKASESDTPKAKAKYSAVDEETKAEKRAREKAEREAKKLAEEELAIQKGYLDSYGQLQADKALEDYNIQLGYLESYRELEVQSAIDVYDKQLKAEEELAKKKEQDLERFKVDTIDYADVAIGAVYGLENALVDAFMTGKVSAQDMFRAIAADLARMAIRQAITAPLMGAIAGSFGGTQVASANGNAFSGGKVQAFANGGAFTNSIATKPTTAPMALFGEAGPEAIMPLTRGADGKLGVVATGAPSQNIKIELINQSGQELSATSSQQRFDGESWVIGVVVDAARRNKGGMRDIMMGGR